MEFIVSYSYPVELMLLTIIIDNEDLFSVSSLHYSYSTGVGREDVEGETLSFFRIIIVKDKHCHTLGIKGKRSNGTFPEG